jgi:hypothetical protein
MGCARQDDMNRAESPWLKSAEFWEEDCDWSIPFIHFAAEIRANMKPAMFIRQFNTAIKTIWFQKDYFDTTINAVTR